MGRASCQWGLFLLFAGGGLFADAETGYFEIGKALISPFHGLRDNAIVIILTEGSEFKLAGRVDDPGDIPVVGGQGFIIIVQQA